MVFYDIGFLLLVTLDIFTAYLILSSTISQEKKLVWLMVALLLPGVGALLYLVLGRSGVA